MSKTFRADALVLFGVTGDLAYKKIFPALYSMVRRDKLAIPIVGVARGGSNLEALIERAQASIQEHGDGFDSRVFESLARLFRYVDGDYAESDTFARIRQALGSAKHPLHYLAIPPSIFPMVTEHLRRAGCTAGARIILEKPFGRDLASAHALNETIHGAFDESSVFRIDHYLGKETVQNLLVLRFANTFLEPIWNRNYVRSVQVTMAEDFGVEGRGKFYEEVGALRDVVQNHMMQVVAFLAMEPPALGYDEALRDEVIKVFRQIKPISRKQIVRGQFRGYRDEDGVDPNSQVETYSALRLDIDSWRWNGVPFFLRTGKKLPLTATEVVVEFQRPPITTFTPHIANSLRLRLSPDLHVSLQTGVKKPGADLEVEPADLTLVSDGHDEGLGAYERLLGEAMRGDPTLFAREDAVEAAWRVFDKVIGLDESIEIYEPGSWGPPKADELVRGWGGWQKVGVS